MAASIKEYIEARKAMIRRLQGQHQVPGSIPKPQVRDWFDKKSSEVVPAGEHDSQEGGG